MHTHTHTLTGQRNKEIHDFDLMASKILDRELSGHGWELEEVLHCLMKRKHNLSNDQNQSIVGQSQLDLRHLMIHFPSSSGLSERASEQMSAVGRANIAGQCRASK